MTLLRIIEQEIKHCSKIYSNAAPLMETNCRAPVGKCDFHVLPTSLINPVSSRSQYSKWIKGSFSTTGVGYFLHRPCGNQQQVSIACHRCQESELWNHTWN